MAITEGLLESIASGVGKLFRKGDTDSPERTQTEPIAPQSVDSCAAVESKEAESPLPRKWPARSRKSIRREEELQKEVARCRALRSRVVNSLAQLDEEKARNLALIKQGESWAESPLSKALQNAENENRKLALFTAELEKAQSSLDKFRAHVEADAPRRARVQGEIADLAGARLELDSLIDEALVKLRELLTQRTSLTDMMRERAQSIELECDLEGGVPPSLYDAAALQIMPASAEWNAIFLGNSEKLKAYVVVIDDFTPGETLARQPIYKFGETVYMSEAEARPLLSLVRRDPTEGRGWGCLPPTLMELEAFEAEKVESGGFIKYHLRQKHEQRQEARRKAYVAQQNGVPFVEQHYGARNG